MVKQTGYIVAFRRRREGLTNYSTRRKTITSIYPRLVARSTGKHTIVQMIVAKPAGDQVLISAHSSELSNKFNWRSSCKNIPAAYLTGFLIGQRARCKKIPKAILDIGLQNPSTQSRVFAVLKGAADAGLDITQGQKVLVNEERIRGEHIVSYARQLSSEEPERYRVTFSRQLSRDLKPERLVEHFTEVKKRIADSFGKRDRYE